MSDARAQGHLPARTSRRGLLRHGLAALAFSPAVQAQAPNAVPPAPLLPARPGGGQGDATLARILDSGRLVVAMGQFETPPFFSTAEGRPQGQDVWFAEQLARALGVPLELRREMRSFNEVVDAVERQEADLAISKISITYPRALRVLFSDPYLVLRHALAFNRVALARQLAGQDLATQVRVWDGEIGVIAKSSFVEFARQRFPRARIVELPSWDALVEAVLEGKVLCAYRDELEIKRIPLKRPSASLHLRTVVLTDTKDSIGMAFHRTATHLQQFTNIFLQNQTEQLSANGLLTKYKPLIKA